MKRNWVYVLNYHFDLYGKIGGSHLFNDLKVSFTCLAVAVQIYYSTIAYFGIRGTVCNRLWCSFLEWNSVTFGAITNRWLNVSTLCCKIPDYMFLEKVYMCNACSVLITNRNDAMFIIYRLKIFHFHSYFFHNSNIYCMMVLCRCMVLKILLTTLYIHFNV